MEEKEVSHNAVVSKLFPLGAKNCNFKQLTGHRNQSLKDAKFCLL